MEWLVVVACCLFAPYLHVRAMRRVERVERASSLRALSALVAVMHE